MAENSPTFQRWGRECRGAQVPKGRLKPCALRQPSLRDLSDHGRWFPTLKRWAIIGCPSGTKREFRGAQVPKGRLKPCATRQPSLRDLSGYGRWFPTLKRWAIIGCPSGTKREFRGAQVPEGRLKPCAIRQPSLRDLSGYGRWFPTLKRWAIIGCPSGTLTWPSFTRPLWERILVALDKNVRAPVVHGYVRAVEGCLICLAFALNSAQAEPLSFDHGSGFYESAFQLVLSAPVKGATIYYTTNE